MKPFVNVHIQETPDITISYRAGKFVYEEGLREGRWISLSTNAAGYMTGVLDHPTRHFRSNRYLGDPQSFSVNVDGQDLTCGWKYEKSDVEYTENGCVCRVTLVHTLRPVTVIIQTKLDCTQILTRRIEVINTSSGISAVSSAAPLAGCIQEMAEVRTRASGIEPIWRVGYMEDGWWSSEGNFQWHDLPNVIYTVCGRYARSDHRHPMFIVENRVTGETIIGQFGWTGAWAFDFDVHADYPFDGTYLSIKMRSNDPAPLRVLQPGETYTSPEAHFGMLYGGHNAAVQEMHKHIRKSVMLPPTRGICGWIQAAIGPEMDMTPEQTMRCAEFAAEIGAEIFLIDAGWFVDNIDDFSVGSGEWRVSRKHYPDGLEPFRKKANENGLLFGLWASIEDGGDNSKVKLEHPEWFWINRKTGKPGGLINMSIPEAAKWVEDNIRYLIEEYGIEMFRLDGGSDSGSGPVTSLFCQEKDGFTETAMTRHYENAYAMYARLRKDYPHVVFENCSGGGGRSDLGMVANFTHTWVTDYQKSPNSVRITNGMTMALPPECVDRLICGQYSFLSADLDSQMRHALFGRMTFTMLSPIYAQDNPEQMAAAKKYVKLYKEFVRPMHPDSIFYHHTPALPGKNLEGAKGVCVMELDAEDASRGMLGVFALVTGGETETHVRLRGVDLSADYEVTFDNRGETCTLSGVKLAQDGLFIRLGGALTSELILYKKK